MNKKIISLLAAMLVVGVLLGRSSKDHTEADTALVEAPTVEIWTCSMHPQIRQPNPGTCPLCAMDLVLARGGGATDELAPRELYLSPGAEALAEVEVVRVERRFVQRQVRMVGKVFYDETRLASITAWVPGRLDRLFVDYTGIEVRQGDHMVELYSPDLVAAQEELIQAMESVGNLREGSELAIRARAEATVSATRDKLRLLGLTEEQIRTIETDRAVNDHITIYSPIRGVVIHKNALEGEYVQVGSRIYTVADLSRVWVKLDAYESDLAWLHYGQEVTFATEASPGDTFQSTIAFIDPVLDPNTRTVKVRVNVENPEGSLKPGMFVRAVVEAEVARGGKVLAANLAGKWICPMHPEIVEDQQEPCEICGMPLVTAESLGYVLNDAAEAPLIIPVSAPLITGKRAVVYVQNPDRRGVYEGREVVLGPRAGDHYVVASGLMEGELVVRKGAFKIDSAMQIQAKPSMMSSVVHDTTFEFREQLAGVYQAYLRMAKALAGNQPVASAAHTWQAALRNVDLSQLEEAQRHSWSRRLAVLQPSSQALSSDELDTVRRAFAAISTELTTALKQFGPMEVGPVYLVHCPMALDGAGADWLQDEAKVQNPYFSGGMPQCGSVKETLQGREADR